MISFAQVWDEKERVSVFQIYHVHHRRLRKDKILSSSDKTEHIAASTLPSFLFGVSGWSVSLFFLLKEADWPNHVYTCITTMQVGSSQDAIVHKFSLEI